MRERHVDELLQAYLRERYGDPNEAAVEQAAQPLPAPPPVPTGGGLQFRYRRRVLLGDVPD